MKRMPTGDSSRRWRGHSSTQPKMRHEAQPGSRAAAAGAGHAPVATGDHLQQHLQSPVHHLMPPLQCLTAATPMHHLRQHHQLQRQWRQQETKRQT